MHNGPAPSKALLAALLLGGFLMAWRMGGTEPRLWNDTLGDQRIVRDCLELGRCDAKGIHASIPGVRVGAGWEMGRAFLESVGLPVTQVHWGVNLLEGTVVPLTALAAWELAGTPAALLSALAVGVTLRVLGMEHDVLYNSRPAPFMGALFLLLAVLAARRRSPLLLALAAATAAVAANLHPVNGFLGGSAVGAGLLFPGRRWRMAILAGLVFAIALFLGAPWMWIENGRLILGGWRAGTMVSPAPDAVGHLALLPGIALAVGLMGVIAARAAPGSPDGRGAATLLWTLLPMAAVFLLSIASGSVPLSDKYLAALVGPVAVGVGVPAAGALAWLGARLGPHLAGLARRVSSSKATTGLAPWIVAATLVALPVPALPGYDGGYRGRAELTLPDIEALADHLRSRGWDAARALRGLGHPAAGDLLAAIDVLAPLPPATPDDSGTRLLVLKVPKPRVPDPLPAEWTLLRSNGGMALVVAPVAGWIDWRRFEVCDAPAPSGPDGPGPCRPTAFVADPSSPAPVPAGMPDLTPGRNATLALRLPLRLPAAPAVHEVRIPRIPGFCPGRVIAVRGGRATIAPDGMGARIQATQPTASDGDLTMSWNIDGEPGQTCFYDGFPPFFLEGEPAALDLIETLLTRPPATGREG